MKWLVEIVDIVADQRLFTDVLTRLNMALHLEDTQTYLIGDAFDLLSTSSEVRKLAERLRDVLSEGTHDFPSSSIRFSLGDIYEQEHGGRRRRDITIQPGGAMVSIVAGGGPISVSKSDPTKKISEEVQAGLEAEYRECQYQEKLNQVLRGVLPAFQNEHARKVQRYLRQEPTPLRLYQIYELIKADLGGEDKNLDSLVSKTERSRFRLSVNHQDVFGDDSRHAALNTEPPEKPMSLDEAQAFIREMANVWLEQKFVEYSEIDLSSQHSS